MKGDAMNKILISLAVLFLGFGVLTFSVIASFSSESKTVSSTELPLGDIDEIEKTLKEGEVNVIIWLKDNQFTSPEYQGNLDEKRAEIKQIQDKVLSVLSKDEFKLKYRYKVTNGFAGAISKSGFDKLKNHPDVVQIFLDREVHATLAESRPLINADDVENILGYTGKRITVCVVDSGVDYNHPALGGGFGPGFKVVGGYDFCNWLWCLGPNDPNPMDENGHGTHVAGIVASQDSTHRGIAPLANIAAVKVLNSRGSGTSSAITAGIDWCVNNAATFNIKVITMSIGDGKQWSSTNCPKHSDPSLQNAYNAGIFTDAASGNENFTNGINYPACSPYVTSVGATYDADVGYKDWGVCTDSTTQTDQIVCFTNRDSNLDLLAPGSIITSTASSQGTVCGAPGGTFGDCSGTSMAAPHVAGAAALLLESDQNYKPSYIEAFLKYAGVPIFDSPTNSTFPRIDAFAAFAKLPGWSNDIRLTFDGDSSYSPSIATDSNGNVHIAWTDYRHGGYTKSEIYYTKLDNNGNTLIDDLRLTFDPTRSRDSSISIDSNGNVHIAWEDYGGDYEIYYTKLDNNGNTLVDNLKLTFDPAYSYDPSISTDSNNNVHIVWWDSKDGNHEIYYTKLDNNGNTIINDSRLTFDSGISRSPLIAIDSNDNVHIEWMDDRDYPGTNNYYEIYYTKLDNNGNTLVDDLRLTFDSSWLWWPSISTDSNDNVHIAWWDERDGGGGAEIYYTKLDNNGNTLIDDSRLIFDSGMSKSPSISIDSNDNVHIAWHDDRDYGNGEIYYKRTLNAPPIITSTPPTEAYLNKNYVYDVEAIDLGGDTLVYNLTKFPQDMTIDSSTGLIEWLPTSSNTGLPDPGSGGSPPVILSGGSGSPTNQTAGPSAPPSGSKQIDNPRIPVTVEVADPFGAKDEQNWEITVSW